MLEDAGVAVLLATRATMASCPSMGEVLLLDDASGTPSVSGDPVSLDQPSPSDSAYMIYTSGSTGKPKGRSMLTRDRQPAVLDAERVRLGASDVVLQKTPCSFDVSVWEFFCP